MSDNPDPTEPKNDSTPKPKPPAQEAPKSDKTDYKAKYEGAIAESRKWEERSKANADAAKRLAEIEDASKTEAERSAERLAAAEKRAAEAEARTHRLDVALEFRLDKKDAALLDAMTDEDAMRALAQRLQAAQSDAVKNGNYVPPEGNTPRQTRDERVAFADYLTGRA